MDSTAEQVNSTQNIHTLLKQLNKQFFNNKLGKTEIKWDHKMLT